MTDNDFLAAYERLSREGKCDGVGGMECRRVLLEWQTMGRPNCIDQFIIARANAGPDGRSRPLFN